jgi:hypothetical protein
MGARYLRAKADCCAAGGISLSAAWLDVRVPIEKTHSKSFQIEIKHLAVDNQT